jgi:hypothetical protein
VRALFEFLSLIFKLVGEIWEHHKERVAADRIQRRIDRELRQKDRLARREQRPVNPKPMP